jgi:hypothetical protein
VGFLLADHCPDGAPGPLGGRGRRAAADQDLRDDDPDAAATSAVADRAAGHCRGAEGTGHSWKPVYYLLEDEVEVQLLNPAQLRSVPSRKTDVTDSAWIARWWSMTGPGELRAAAPPIRRQRDLTRYRAAPDQGAYPRETADLERSGG